MMGSIFLAVIPARRGSKGMPRKNTALINNFPLLHWTVVAAKESKLITNIIISSDDEDVLLYAKENDVPARSRPKNICNDDSTSEE